MRGRLVWLWLGHGGLVRLRGIGIPRDGLRGRSLGVGGCVCVCVCVCVERERGGRREKEREGENKRERDSISHEQTVYIIIKRNTPTWWGRSLSTCGIISRGWSYIRGRGMNHNDLSGRGRGNVVHMDVAVVVSEVMVMVMAKMVMVMMSYVMSHISSVSCAVGLMVLHVGLGLRERERGR